MTQSNLKLFRRHEKSCTAGYEKDFRVYQWMVEKQKGRKATVDCACNIYTEGTLVNGGTKTYVRPKSTDKRTWAEAEAVKANWLKWGDTKPPTDQQSEDEAQAGTLVTLQAAVNAFMALKGNQEKSHQISHNRSEDVKQFLQKRLVPFSTITKKLTYVNEMDNEAVWGEFMASWQNLNDESKHLAPSTVRLTVANTREFLKFCVRREWLSDNWLSEEYGVTTSFVYKPKEPLTEQELSYVYQAAKEITPGIGKHFHTGERRAKELLVFIWTLRYTGLRISDVAELRVNQLQRFNHGGYTHAIWCNPKKTERSRTENFVHIPIPSENFPNHPNIAKALTEVAAQPKQGQYFFKRGTGIMESTIDVWRRQIIRAIKRAEELMEADGLPERNGTHFGGMSKTPEHPTPHSFRHTFSATLLQGGAPIRLVAQYLGDTEKTVREHYAKFCVLEQEQSAVRLSDAMARYDEQTSASRRDRMRVVK